MASITSKQVFRVIKFPLKKLINGTERIAAIDQAVKRAQLIRRCVSEFVKLYCCHLYEQGAPLPRLNASFYTSAIRVVCQSKSTPRKKKRPKKMRYFNTIKLKSGKRRRFVVIRVPTIKRPPVVQTNHQDDMYKFYDSTYKPLCPDLIKPISFVNMSHITAYMAEEMATTQETNITTNFYNCLARFVNSYGLRHYYQERGWATDYRMSKQERQAAYGLLRSFKDDLIMLRTGNQRKTPAQYHGLLEQCRQLTIPSGARINTTYDVKVRPMVYLPYIIRMNKLLEAIGKSCYGVFCLRSGLVPGYIKIDTSALLDLLYKKEDAVAFGVLHGLDIKGKKQIYDNLGKLKNKDVTNQEIFDHKTNQWKFVCKFGTNKYTRHLLQDNDYIFNNTILTDGVGASVLMLRKDLKGEHRFTKSAVSRSQQQEDFTTDVQYLCDLQPAELEFIRDKCVRVSCDGGKKNIVTVGDKGGPNSKQRVVRYTSQQRAVEGRHKKNKRVMVSIKKNTAAFTNDNLRKPDKRPATDKMKAKGVMSGGRRQSIEEYEQSVNFNARSCNVNVFQHAIVGRRKLDEAVGLTYNEPIFRQLRFSSLVHTRKSEDKLLNKIFKTFQDKSSKPLAIMWGNWGAHKHLKNFIPTPGVGLRKRLMRRGAARGLKIYLVNERNTSKRCYTCGTGENEYIKTRTYSQFNKKTNEVKTKTIPVHGLLRCNNNETCGRLWNRDVNAYLNILEIAESILCGNGIPQKFT